MRKKHIEGVIEQTEKLCSIYQLPSERFVIAARYHDICKLLPYSEQREKAQQFQDTDSFYLNHQALIHAPAAAFKAIEDGITDSEIIDAIAYHPTGRAQCSQILQMLMVADFCEPYRTFKEAEEIRMISEKDFHQAFYRCVTYKIMFCLKENKKVYPDTLLLYNSLCRNQHES